MYVYPYGDSQQLNLDWIINKLKELEDREASAADLEEIANVFIALTHSSGTQYRRYDYCYYQGKLYRALNDNIGAFNASDWLEVRLGDDIPVLTRLINAIDAAAVVDVKFDTSGTNGKLQQKYNNAYHDVVEVDYTPVENSKRPLSSNAGHELNGAITNGTLLNGMPQTAMRIPTNSDLNSYTTAGTYFVYSDADAATISHIPRPASGTLFVINRAVENYKTQFYYPTSSLIINFVRNYNNGTWTDWQTNRNPNENLATLEDSSTSTHSYVVGDLLVWIGKLYRVISQISVGDGFESGTNITPVNLSTANDSGAGYCKMADGTLLQWGTGSIPSGVYVQTDYTTFAKPFIDTNYITMITPDDDVNISNPVSANKTTTGFKCGRAPNTATNNYTWYAIGRWK